MTANKTIVDPAFLRETQYSYVNYNQDDLDSVLCFALARHKKDLILHQQRIEFYSKSDNSSKVYTAIIDLFIALGNKGKDYKKRILDRYMFHLSESQSIALKHYFENNIDSSSAVQNLNESVLNLGICGQILSNKHLK